MSADPLNATPGAQVRRSFVYRLLQAAGARFATVNGGVVAMEYGRPAGTEIAQAGELGLADLSVLPRTGFKGTGTAEWLAAQGLEIGADSNKAYRQSGGALAARLAPSEVLLLDGLDGTGTAIGRLDQAWAWGSERPRRPIGYPVPRSESHAWFFVCGRFAPSMFAKICGVDLRLKRFAEGQIAQTSVAKMNAIVIRTDLGVTPGFQVLADSASAEYLWGCIVDAMEEFGGAVVGLTALREAGRQS